MARHYKCSFANSAGEPLGLTLLCTRGVLSQDDLRMARDASHKLQLLQAQAQQVEELQRQLAQHRRNTAEWKERCRQQVSWASRETAG